ncbi:MAG TPA: hypothetical protein O0X70_00340 [Methanocorpusculum sp.]|nr:hypothetical protein [Methanocorpusculum sp.]
MTETEEIRKLQEQIRELTQKIDALKKQIDEMPRLSKEAVIYLNKASKIPGSIFRHF